MRIRQEPKNNTYINITENIRSVRVNNPLYPPGYYNINSVRKTVIPEASYFSKLSYIKDDISPLGKRNVWKSCWHRSINVTEPYSHSLTIAGPWNPLCTPSGEWFPASQTYGIERNHPVHVSNPSYNAPSHLAIDFNTLRNDAIDDALGLLNPGTLSLVSIAELLSIKESIKSTIDLLKGLKLRNLKSNSFRSLLRMVSRGELGYRFFIRQLATDVKAVFTTVDKVEERMRQFQSRNAQQFFTVSKRMTATQDNVTTLGCYNIQCSGKYTIDDKQYANIVADALGTNRIATSLWDVVPYSFIIDYFIGLGDLIARLEARALARERGNNIMLHQACLSRKTIKTIRTDLSYFLLCEKEATHAHYFTYEDKLYEREVVPVGSLIPLLDTGNASAWEWQTIGAVVLSRKSR